MFMIRYIAAFLIALLPAVVGAVSPDKVPNVHVMRTDSWVSDPDHLLSDAARQHADSILNRLSNATTAEVTVAMVADLDGQDIDSYATELFELWGIGKKDRDNGLLMVISRDDRRAALRTGYGMEGVINDARAGRIIRQDIAPNMKTGNIDSALIQAVEAISLYVTDPEAADYLHSDQKANAHGDDDLSLKEFMNGWLTLSAIAIVVLLAWLLVTYFSSRGESDPRRYARLDSMRLPFLMAIPATLGIGVIAWLPLWLMMRHVRLHRHDCPNCGTRMHRVDEVHDNDYLTPAQDIEEKLNSVDYDVWLCPRCNETDILPYINRRSSYTVCPDCGARARALVANRILRQPTTRYEGQGVRIFRCNNCGHETQTPYTIAKIVQPPIVIVGGGGGGRGFGGGGGFSGGSFGGGMTGGGGASGGW